MARDDVRRTLSGILREYGVGVCEPPSCVRNFLCDLCPTEKSDINLLITTLTACSLAYFQAIKKGHAEKLLIVRIESLQYDLSITTEAVHWAVETWALALGVVDKPLPPISIPVQKNADAQSFPAFRMFPPEAAEVPLALSLDQTVPSVPNQSFSPAVPLKSQRTLGISLPVIAAAVGIAALGLLLLVSIMASFGRPHSPPVASATGSEASLPLLTSADPAASRKQALAQRIEQIRSGLEPGTVLVWPLSGKENGMKIVLPPKRPGAAVSLLGSADLHQGCTVLRTELIQALQDAGCSDADIASCSVFVCSSNGGQLAFATASY